MDFNRTLKYIAAACLLIAAGDAPAAINAWTLTGPDAGVMDALAIQPTNSQVAVASTPRGFYRTTNGGNSWTLVKEGLDPRVSYIVFDPTNANRVFAASGILWRSDDAGQTFSVLPDPQFRSFNIVDFSAAGTLYAANFSGQVFKSTNQGGTWTACPTPWGSQVSSATFAVDRNPNAQDRMFIHIDAGDGNAASGTYRSVDGCTSWTQGAPGSPGSTTSTWVARYAVMPGNPNRIVAATRAGMRMSNDGGNTWAATPGSNYETLWVQFDPTTAGGVVAIEAPSHIIRSADNGASWTYGGSPSIDGQSRVVLDPQTPGRMFMLTRNGPFLSVDSGGSFSLRATGLRAALLSDISVSNDGTVYAVFGTGGHGVYRRDPTTTAWQPVNNANLQAAQIGGFFSLGHVAVAPTSSQLVYAGVYFGNLLRSNNSGNTWQPPNAALLSTLATLHSTAVDPDNAQVAYTTTVNHGLWKTADGGVTWAPSNTGLPSASSVIAVAKGSDTVYVAAGTTVFPTSIYKSVDGGANWAITGATPVPPSGGAIISLAIDPTDTNVVYAGFTYALYKSINGGASWQPIRIFDSDATANPNSILIDPRYPSTVIISGSTYGDGLLRTVDGGGTWQRIDITLPSPGWMTLMKAVLNPMKPSQVIAGVNGASVAEYEIATDLSLTVSGVAANLVNGTSVTGAFTVRNNGPHPASPAEVSVGLPLWLDATVPGNCTRAGQILTCAIPPLQVGDSSSFQLPLAIAPAGGTGQLTASVLGHETEIDSTNNNRTLALSATEQADLALTLAAAPVDIDHGAATTLTAGAVNHGPGASTATHLTLTVPAGLTVQSITPATGTCSNTAGLIDCDLGTLALDAVTSVTLQLQGATIGALAIAGQLDGAGTDNDTDQNATATVTVRAVGDVGVELAESADPVTLGTPFQYTATLRNNGPDPGAVHLVVPVAGASVASAVPTGATCIAAATLVTCDVSSLASGATASVVINLDSLAAGIATATATAAFGGTDTQVANNAATIGTTLRLVGDISVEVTGNPASAAIAQTFAYTVTVRNAGPNAGAVHVAIPVTGAAVASATATAGTCTATATAATCEIAALANGGASTITINVAAAAAGTVSAIATATFTGTDLATANNTATANTVVNPAPVTPTQPSAPNGGGGGGAFDWLALVLLGVAGWRRAVR